MNLRHGLKIAKELVGVSITALAAAIADEVKEYDRRFQQGYAFKARAHKFTLLLHHSPFSLKLRLRQRGIKLEMRVQPCSKTTRRRTRNLELVIPWGLLQGLFIRNTSPGTSVEGSL